MPTLCQRRGALPDVSRWQSTYVKYKGQNEGQVCQQGWDLATSQSIQDQLALANNSAFPNSRSPLHTGLAPTGINMRMVTAPAEFAAPVKQDRRLTPDFKVRVEVRYRGKVSFPLTVRAYILSQQEKDNLPEWAPDGSSDHENQGDRHKPPTELKGTTYITHHFEENMSGVLSSSLGSSGRSAVQGHLSHLPHMVQSNVLQSPQYMGSQGSLHHESLQMQAQRYIQHQNHALLHHAGLLGQPLGPSDEALNLDTSNPFSLNSGTTQSTLSSLGDFSDASNFAHMLQEILGDGDGVGNVPSDLLQGVEGTGGVSVKPEHIIPPGDQKIILNGAVLEEEGTLMHDFEFLNLEFVRPTRMSKVYICFACMIMEHDLLYCIFHIPTVGICRAEQRSKASEKLGIPRAVSDMTGYDVTGPANSETSGYSSQIVGGRKRVSRLMDAAENHDGCRRPFETMSSLDPQDAVMKSPGDPLPHSRQALRDWILEEYDSRGWRRRLTELDLQTLESQAGFPVGGGDVDVSAIQWEEFTSQFRDVLNLLAKISAVWNLEDPCVISGLDMDRCRTSQALAREPPGTFICRLSWSEPGSLVLTCKVSPGNQAADGDGLVHVIIGMKDLNERRVDTWIRDYPSATHVLDVYTHKRVDKRKVFASHYTRLKLMDDLETVSQG